MGVCIMHKIGARTVDVTDEPESGNEGNMTQARAESAEHVEMHRVDNAHRLRKEKLSNIRAAARVAEGHGL